jgi:hypothetical protein
MDKCLFNFPFTTPNRTFLWDLKDFLSLKDFKKYVKESEKLELIDEVIVLWERNREKISINIKKGL